jgi:muramidase (phage lysozyme)
LLSHSGLLQPLQDRLSLIACLGLLASAPTDLPRPWVGSFAPGADGRINEQIQPGAHNAAPRYAVTPQRQALLDTIRYAEGTWTQGDERGYRTLYGGGVFQGLSHHPNITVHKRYSSAAAGAYQFLPGTWNEVARQLRLPSFEPPYQDQAALHLIERRGALQLVDQRGISREVVARLAPEWASLPTHRGSSHYGQPVKSYTDLQRFYAEALQRHDRA